MFDVQDLQQTAAPSDAARTAVVSATTQVHLLDRLTAVFRHRKVAGTAFVIVVGLMMLQTYSKIPLYRSSARVEIRDERTTAVGNLNSNDPMFWQDSEQVPQHPVQHFAQPQSRQARRSPAAVCTITRSSTAARRRAAARCGAVREARKAIGTSARSWSRERRTSTDRKPAADESAVESGLISQFLGGVDIVPEKSTRLVEVIYTSSSPEFAALAATTLAEEYAQQNLDLRLETINKNLVWLSDEVVKQEKKVTEAETAMAQYREQQNALSLEDRQNIVVSRLNTLNDTATRARTDAAAEGSRLQPGEVGRSEERRRRRVPGDRGQSWRDGSQDAAERLDRGQGAAVVTVPARAPGPHQGRGADRERARSARSRSARA